MICQAVFLQEREILKTGKKRPSALNIRMNIRIRPIMVKGNWRAGWALDLHTVTSKFVSNGSFDTTRTEIGELLYNLKYQGDESKIRPIAEIAARFIQNRWVFENISAIIPIPPSDLEREFQPVFKVTEEIGRIVNRPAPLNYLVKIRKTVPLKSLEEYTSRKEQLKGAFDVRDQRYESQCVLLFDDLYRSGETLRAATEVLMEKGKISRVYVLTLTKTRIKR